ncbi:MAG: hypothetical protein H7Y59_05805 [Anaerolineales bacterium]|nr:hypothetical protein [Anaerolineales bacterium]
MLKKIFANYLKKERFTAPSIIFLLILLAYGLLIPWMGFYWDDWPFAWFLHFFGPAEFIESFRPFRPFLGPIFQLTTTLFGGNPLTWQVIGLIARFLLSLELWLVLRLTWPTQKQNLMWVVFLFTVYPAYQQQWVALTHVNQELIPFLFLLSSFIVTLWLVRNGRYQKRLTVLAIILQAIGLFTTEYFFGLEILRFFFLLALFAETITDRKNLLQKTSLQCLPYFVVWILNAVWTYSYHQSTAYSSYDFSLLSSSTLSPLVLGNEFLTTISLSGFTSWLGTFDIFSTIDGTFTQVMALVILIISATVLFIVMRSSQTEILETSTSQNDNWGLWAVTIGLAAIFAGRLPSWAAGLPLKIEFDYDRFFVSIMLGASLFIVGLATLVLQEGKRRVFILSLLIGMSTAYQFSIANTYRRDWANQQNFFWQLAWRMPALEEDTALLTYELPLKYVSDLQLTAPLNWIYAPDFNDRDLPYVLFYLKTRFNSASIQADEPIQLQYRTVNFNGSTSDSVVIYKEADGCLRVLDPLYGNAETVPGANDYLINAIPLSNPDLIKTDAGELVLDKTLFGTEPAHGWCYYYTKAELARQQTDWEQVVNLFNQAQKDGFSASMPVENLPFIEGFALTGDTDMAIKLTERTLKTQKELCPAIYTLWDRVLQTSSTQTLNVSEINEHIRQSGCKP